MLSVVGPKLFMERIERLEREVKKLERRQKLLEESLPSLEDLKALIEAEEDLKKGRVVPLSKIEEELRKKLSCSLKIPLPKERLNSKVWKMFLG